MSKNIENFAVLTALILSSAALALQDDAGIDDDASPMDQSVPVAAEEPLAEDGADTEADSETDGVAVGDETEKVSEQRLLEEFARYRFADQ